MIKKAKGTRIKIHKTAISRTMNYFTIRLIKVKEKKMIQFRILKQTKKILKQTIKKNCREKLINNRKTNRLIKN